MNDYQLTNYNFDNVTFELKKELQNEPVLVLQVKSATVGKWTITRLWRSWMASTAEVMDGNGVTMPLMISSDGKHYGSRSFNSEDAHELFTNRWLGVDENGNRLSWSKSDNNGMRAATKGERLHAMRQHEEWATERGILLMQPSDSEYMRLKNEQDN